MGVTAVSDRTTLQTRLGEGTSARCSLCMPVRCVPMGMQASFSFDEDTCDSTRSTMYMHRHNGPVMTG